MEAEYPHVVRMPYSVATIHEVMDRALHARRWCEETHGTPYTLDGVRICGDTDWASHGRSFYFKDPNAAFEFKLRWC